MAQQRPSRLNNFSRNTARPLEMRLLADEAEFNRIIREPTVNRPGLALSGFTQYFAYKRVQVFGNAEVFYLRSLSHEQRESRYAYLFAYKIPCVVFSRDLKPDKEFLAAAEKAGVPVFQTPAGHDEFHQHRDARAGNDVRAARHGNRQHGGHPRRRRDHPRRKRHRQKRGGAGADRARLQPRFRRCDEGRRWSTATT